MPRVPRVGVEHLHHLLSAGEAHHVVPEERDLVRASALIAAFILLMIGTCQLAALVKFWPYDMSLSLKSYDFGKVDGGA